MKPLDPVTIALTGTNLIEASAGTGKTHTITNLYVRMLLELRLEVSQILVVTYTNAATAELRARVRRRLREALAAFATSGNDDEFFGPLVETRRAAGMLDQDRLRLVVALHTFDEAAIFTIHGFCQRMLQENAFESGVAFDTELITNQSPLLTEVVEDFWVRELHAAPEPFVCHLADHQISPQTLERLALKAIGNPDMPVLPRRAEAGDDDSLAARALRFQLDLIDYARRELRARKARARTQSFDDLLQRLAEALRGPGATSLAAMIRRRFRAALIDEFQDTDPVQYEIFQRLYRGTDAALFLIGDPKQAIYAFRGADVFAYIQAKHDAGEAPHTLQVNHRSDPRLVGGVNALFGRARQAFVFDEIPFIEIAPAPHARDHLRGSAAGLPPLQVLFVRRTEAERWTDGAINAVSTGGAINKGWGDGPLGRVVASEIVRFLGSGATIDGRPVEPGDLAVLCRKNAQASLMQQALRDLGVPSVLQTEASVFEAPDAEEVQRVLLAMADPGDARALRAALCTTLLGQQAQDLCALEHDEERWDDWVRQFQAWHERWTERSFVAAFRALLDSQGVQQRLLGLLDGERRLTNVLHLMELLHAASTEERRGPRALLHWLTQMRTDAAARAALAGETTQIRLESDAKAVQLTTVHRSKGLQYPIVYCPYLWDGTLLIGDEKQAPRFHDPSDALRLTLDLGSDDQAAHVALAEKEVFAENLRLVYVALTRAQHRCSVVWGAFKTGESSALGYLLHQPRDQPGDPRANAKARITSFIKSRDDGAMRADIEALAATAPGCIGVTDLTVAAAARYDHTPGQTPGLQCRATARELHRIWRVSSFSALAAAERTLSEPADAGVDHDAGTERIAIEEPSGQPAGPPVVVLHDFPAGARAGQLVHEILQHLDFSAADATTLRELVARVIGRFGFEDKWTKPLSSGLADVLATPLDAGRGSIRLRDVPPHRRLTELEFVLPVAETHSDSASAAQIERSALLTTTRLADVFARHAAPPVPLDYAQQLRRLGFGPLAGFLRGFIDLVFEHAGRWYVVDYKSNRLGPQPADYKPARLLDAMREHHYFLQYHLYVAALHRYLATRLPDYDYGRHFGGVYYLFVRGMAPAHEPGTGVFSDRPSSALIENLSAVLAGHPVGER